MRINRRNLIEGGAALGVMASLPRLAHAQATFAPRPAGWRNFQIVTRLEIAKPAGKVQAWVPVPAVNESDWFRSGESTWATNAKTASLKTDAKYAAEFVHAEWDASEKAPVIEVTSRFSAQDRAVDVTRPGRAAPLSEADRKLYTGATELIPIGGLVKQQSDRIVAGAVTDLQKARRIYNWVVENSARNPSTRGCGIGDVAAMLKSGDLSGKCADLNALYVGLARAAGLPARDVYGLRVAPSRFGYRSLGAGSNNVTKAQHCRAEVYLTGLGWVPVDPADVRKVMLEEPPANLSLEDAKVVAARRALFGSWEGNWLAYNFAHDVMLPGATGEPIAFLMYPQAENGTERLDALDPENFRYTITSQELSS